MSRITAPAQDRDHASYSYMGWKKQQAFDDDANERLGPLLGRRPTTKEIAHLRHGEQALGLETPAINKARKLSGQARTLTQLSKELVAEVRTHRKQAKRTLLKAARNRQDRSAA